MEKLIDQAWDSLLASVLKKRNVIRRGLGDDIDLYVPQSRILSLIDADNSTARSLYISARDSARRNAVSIVSKLGMPADYFWKFEYWPKARAYTILEKITSRVFSSIMRKAKEGELKITEVSIDPLVIDISFTDCVECAGLEGLDHEVCFYHAGTFAGILSGLINRDLDGFESECHASGSKACHFRICDISEGGMDSLFDVFISSPGVKADIVSRLEQSLKNKPARDMGNLVDINYHQLTVANYLLSNPGLLASQSYNTGVSLGKKLAPVLSENFDGGELNQLEDFYMQIGEFGVAISKDGDNTELVINECAEVSGSSHLPEMTSFLEGELCGLLSSLFHKEMVLEQSRFEGDNLLVSFVPKG